jgi:hypothetical protein
MLKHFTINTERDLLVPDLQCYQMGLRTLVDNLSAQGLVEEDFKLLPSWNKFVENPVRGKGFFTQMLQAIFVGTHNLDELSIDIQTDNQAGDTRVAMMFLPDNTRNKMSVVIERIAREALPNYEVIVLSGAVTYRGKRVTNRNAEKIVKELVEARKSTLIITSKIAQRSFSIPQITELYLAYDRGSEGATLQKMSRTLTPHDLDKVGRVISLSFDPNRDDKFDGVIIETALNIKARLGMTSTKEAIRFVLRTMDIFSCQPDGAVKIEVDDYLKHAMERKGVSRVIGNKLDLFKLDTKTLTALASGKIDYMRSAARDAAPMGKVHDLVVTNRGATPKRTPRRTVDKETARHLMKAREVALTILENLDIIMYGTNQRNIHDALHVIENDSEMQRVVEEEFGVPFEIITLLFSRKVINQAHVELLYDLVS